MRSSGAAAISILYFGLFVCPYVLLSVCRELTSALDTNAHTCLCASFSFFEGRFILKQMKTDKYMWNFPFGPVWSSFWTQTHTITKVFLCVCVCVCGLMCGHHTCLWLQREDELIFVAVRDSSVFLFSLLFFPPIMWWKRSNGKTASGEGQKHEEGSFS